LTYTAPPPASAPPARILVVDDDPLIRRQLEDLFASHAYSVASAASCDEALGNLRAEVAPARAHGADRFDQLGFRFLVAVAHIDSKSVSSGKHELLDHLGLARRRSQRRQDFHFAGARSQRLGQLASFQCREGQ